MGNLLAYLCAVIDGIFGLWNASYHKLLLQEPIIMNDCEQKTRKLISFAVDKPHSFHFYLPAFLVQNQLIDVAERNKSIDRCNLDARELIPCKIRCM